VALEVRLDQRFVVPGACAMYDTERRGVLTVVAARVNEFETAVA
jgi:hypothetical protein